MKRRDFLSYSALFLSGCTGATVADSPSPSLAPMSDRPTELKFAVTDLSGLEELEQNFEPFRQELEKVIGIPISFYPVPNYSAAAPALLANDLDLAFAGPSEYLLLRARAQSEPLVEVSRQNYYSVIMTRKDSGITSLEDLTGKTVAMRSEGSTAGHIFPMKLFMDVGVNPQDLQVKMLNKQGIDALRAGEVDAWTDSHDRYVELVKEPGLEGTEITVLKKGDPLPGDVFVANHSLGMDFIQELRSAMLTHQEPLLSALASSEANDKYLGSSMLVAQDSNYDTMRSIYRAIGLESAIQ